MLLHADGFATYGDGLTVPDANMLEGVYAEVTAASASIVTTPVAGDGTHAFRSTGQATANPTTLRKALDTPVNEIIVGGRFRFDNLPSSEARLQPIQLRDAANVNQLTLAFSTTGIAEVRNGGVAGTIVASSATPAIIAGSYQFIEMYAKIGNADGEVEVRVDGEVVISASAIDTQATANTTIANVDMATSRTGGSNLYMMDPYICDLNGTVNNDFLGDVQWITRFPNSDGAVSDWTRNTGSNDWEMLDDNPPDDDTTYIEAASVNDISEFGFAALPAGAAEVVAVITRPVLRKTSAGSGSAQVSVISALASPETEVSGTDRPMTETYTYYSDIFETDPETGAAWSVAAANALRLKLERTL